MKANISMLQVGLFWIFFILINLSTQAWDFSDIQMVTASYAGYKDLILFTLVFGLVDLLFLYFYFTTVSKKMANPRREMVN